MRPILPAVIRFGREAPPPASADAAAEIQQLRRNLEVAHADLARADAREAHLRLGMDDLRQERDQLRRALADGGQAPGEAWVEELRRENVRLRRVAEQDRRNARRLDDRLAAAEGRSSRWSPSKATDDGNWEDHAWTGRP